jgi:hypothetical protein
VPDNGGPAFPTPQREGTFGESQDGMSLRDYFAAAAVQGICAKGFQTEAVAAAQAYRLADAMIAAREK